MLFALFAVSRCITVVQAGHVGVVDVFGQVSNTALKSGLQFVNPLARVIHMTIQTREVKETMDVPSKEGLTVRLEMSVLYHLDPEKAADVYRTVGLDYPSVLLSLSSAPSHAASRLAMRRARCTRPSANSWRT